MPRHCRFMPGRPVTAPAFLVRWYHAKKAFKQSSPQLAHRGRLHDRAEWRDFTKLMHTPGYGELGILLGEGCTTAVVITKMYHWKSCDKISSRSQGCA